MPSRRKYLVLVVLLVAAGMATCTDSALAGPCDPPANEIVCENSKEGNPPSEWDVEGAGDPSIQGFATSMGVDRGETVHFKIDTPSTAYRLDIYRMGYYDGKGARKITSIKPSAALPQTQPPCEEDEATGLIDCGNWSESASWAVPATAVSGIYFAKLVREDQASEGSHIMFVVRDDGGGSDLLFQTSDASWEAYNRYGGKSLYVGGPGEDPGRAYKVSYNRPLTVRGTTPEDSPFNAEYPMVRWLERNGYDVSYTTEGDVDANGSSLLEHKTFLSVGHDEYWSGAQRANVTAARDAGVNLAFFSGNEIFWKTRWEDDHRTLVCYKETHANEKIDPESNVWTGTWRDPRFGPQDGKEPENALSGTIFMVDDGTTAIEVPAAEGKLRLWRNTNIAELAPGETATLAANTLGYEWDEDLDNGFRPKGLFRLSSTTTEVPKKLEDFGSTYGPGTATHHLTEYRAPSGALVFSAGTVQWSWGLEGEHDRGESTPDDRMRQATVNLLADMGSQPQTLQEGLVAATETTDKTPPTSTIVTPGNGGKVEVGTPVTISGTAGDETGETEPGGAVAGVEVSVDDGTTWHPAEGRGTWSYTWTPDALGAATIRARAVDDSGNLQPTAAQISVTAEPRQCPCSIWGGNFAAEQADDKNSVELGLRFRADADGFITGIRFYKTAENFGTHTGRLWTNDGTLLGHVTFMNESPSGWQQATFEEPIAIQAGATYVVSYHAPFGHYAAIKDFFTTGGTDNQPLHALADGVDGGNGIFNYGPAGGLFSAGGPFTFEATNYLVDPVFTEELEVDETPPVITSRVPIAGAIEVDNEAPVTATLSEPIKPGSVSSSTVELRDESNDPVEAGVSYSVPNRRITLTPSEPLEFSSQYTMRIKGGAGGITDLAGNPMSADAAWTFTTAAAPPPPPDEGPGGPILVITNVENQFGSYYPEILRAEGLNEFVATDISKVTPAVLNAHDVAILAQGRISSGQAQMLTEWVQQGGNLIAMRPDSKLLGLLGLSSAGGVLANAYMGVDTSTAPGAGIIGETIQFHGNADRYTTAGAEAIASLYSNASAKTSNPAVTLRQVGSNGGSAAAFSYDLARSVVYTRQGNPAWAGEDRDGIGPIRPDDLFFGDKAGDPQPEWVDPNKIAIPQADEQQRLLTNLIGQMNLDRKPLPRFWFLPRDKKAVVVMTGDDHGNGGTVGRFEQLEELGPPGCSVADWECVRATSYVFPDTPISDATAAKLTGEGFEIGLHLSTNCEDWSSTSQLETLYSDQLAEWSADFPSLASPSTSRTHCITWSDWASQPKVELENGIRLDTDYYYWPPQWVQDRPGLFTGSGMPMRFADRNGSPINVYQATTQMTDESNQSYPATIDALLGNALGPKGYYGVFTANMHTDVPTSADGEAIINAARANGVPVVSAKQMLTWLDGRNQSSFNSIGWAGGKLQFTISPGPGATGLRAMVPVSASIGDLESLQRGATTVPTTVQTIKGVEYAFFDATAGSYTAKYENPAPPAPSLTATIPLSPANDNNPEVTGSATAGTTVKIYAGSSCTGSPVATGTAAQLAAGITANVADNSTTAFRATATTASEATSSCSAPISYVEDSTAPDTSISQSPSANAPSGSAEFKFSGNDGAGSGVASFQCRLDSSQEADWAACASPKTYSSLADGTHKFEVRAIDNAGNVDQSASSFTWRVDTTPPDTAIDSSPPAISGSAAASFTFSGTDAGGSGIASFECRRDGAAFAPCTSPQAYSGLADGSHTFDVRAVDQAGNIDQSAASSSWTVDTIPPNTTITQSPSTPSPSATAEFKFNGDDGAGSGVASFQCRLDSSQEAEWGNCSSPQSYSALADGSHKFEVRAVDHAGKTDQTPDSANWTVDTAAPSTSITQSPSTPTASGDSKFEFTGNDGAGSGVASFQCRLDSSQEAAWASCTSPKNYSSLADGSHKFEVRAIDQAGNTDGSAASSTWTVDTTAPDTSIGSSPPALTNSATANFSFSGSDTGGSGVAGFQCRRDSTQAADWASCTSPKSYPALSDGSHKFEVRAIDQAGNIDQSAATFAWTVDTTPPNTAIDSSPPAISGSAAASFTFSGTDVGGSGVASFECRRDGAAFAPCTSPQAYSGLADGSHAFEVRAIDHAGNTDGSAASSTWTVDTTAPDTSIGSSPPALTNSATASFSFSGTDTGGSGVASFQCRRDSTQTADWAACPSPESYPALSDGSHKFEVRAIDQAGNIDPTPAESTWTVDTGAPQTTITQGPATLVATNSAEFKFSGNDGAGSGVASFQCRLDSSQEAAWGTCASPKTYSSLADGSHKFEVRAIDNAGNVDPSAASSTWTVDTTPPNTAIDSSPPAISGSAAASFTFSGTDVGGSGIASFECRRDGAAFAPCASPQAYSGLADGSHTFDVRAIDQAGNVDQSAASSTWSVDTTPPNTTITQSPASPISSGVAEFKFTGDDGTGSGIASFQCRLDSTEAAAWATCSSPKSYSGLNDGSHTVEVRSIDHAGNVDASAASFTWTVDTTPPNTTITQGPASPISSGVAEFKFSGNDGTGSGVGSFQCRLDSTQEAAWASCTSPKTYSSLADGSHKFEVRAIDQAGNVDQSAASSTWTVDTTPPDTTITQSPASPIASGGAEFKFNGNDGTGSGVASFQCRLDSTQAADWAACASGKSYAGLADGSHKFEVRAIDQAGNVDQSAASFSWTVDTTAPDTSITQSPANPISSGNAEFKFTGNDGTGSGVASFQCRLDSTQEADWVACPSPKTYSSLADGSHTFDVRAVDQAGNVDQSAASSTWRVDTTPPNTAIDSSPPAISGSAGASFSFSGTDVSGSGVASFECRRDGAAFAPCTSPQAYSGLADGSHTFDVRAIDQAGNVDQSAASSSWTVDTTAPNTSITQSPASPIASGNAEFKFTGNDGTGSGVASFQCRLDSTQEADWASCPSPKTYAGLAEGSHKFEVRAIDQAGNTDQTPATSTWIVDTSGPNTTIDLSPPSISGSAAASFTFSGTDGSGSGIASFECRRDGAAFAACTSPQTYSGLADGSHTFEVRAIDQAGNVDQSAAGFTWTVDTTAPQTTITQSPPTLVASGSAELKFSGNDGTGSGIASFQCRLDSNQASDWAACSSAKSYAGLADGSHKFEVRAIDVAGNIDASPDSATWTVDTTAPNTTIDSSPPVLTKSAAASFTFSGADGSGSGVASFECRRDGAAFAPCTSPQAYSGLADGSHTFEVRAIDHAGNTDQSAAGFTWTVDTTPPTVSIDSGPSGLTNDATPTFTFSSEAGASFECSIDTGTPNFGACSGSGTHTSALPLADGAYTFRVRATDTATNSSIATQSFTVDTTAPSAPELTETIPASPANQNAPKVVGTAPAGSTVSLYTTVDCSGTPIATTSAAALAAGVTVSVADDTTTRFRATVTDEAANPSACSSALTYIEDSTPPQTQIDSSPPAQSGSSGASFGFSGSDSGGSGVASFQCRIDSTQAADWAACPSPKTYSSLADGSHKFEVRAIDQAGNVDQSAAGFSWTIDTGAPQTTITQSPATPIASGAAEFKFSGDDGAGTGIASFQCRLDSSQEADWSSCSSPKSYSGLPDGSHKFEVRAIDHAGNVDQSAASSTWTIDTTAPQTTITQNPPTLVASGTAEFKFSGDDGTGSGVAAFQCRLDSSQEAAWGSCNSPKSYSILADGGHKFEVRAIDQAGNVDQSAASSTWTIDTTAPDTSIGSSPPALTNNGTASFSFSGSDTGGSGVAGFQCRLDSTQAAGWASCTSPKSYASLADGSHKFEVRAIDQPGNTDTTPASFTWTVDTTPPTVSIDSGPSGLTNDSTPTFTFSSEPGVSFECSIDTGIPSFGTCSGNGTHTPGSPLTDGAYTFRVRATDAATNSAVATQSFTLDTAAPSAPELTASVPASPANDNSPKLIGSAPDESTVRLYTTNDCSGSAIATATAAELAAGVTVAVSDDSLTRFRATSTSPAGNPSSCSAALTYREDSTAPQTQVDSGPPTQSNSAAASLSFSGTDTGGSGVASFQCRIDSTQTSDWTTCNSPKSYSALAEGSHKFEVRATDQAGNTDATPASFTWNVDTAAPNTSIDFHPGALDATGAAEFKFSGDDGAGSGVASFQCRLDSTEAAAWSPCSSPKSYASVTDGNHKFEVRSIDQAGNVDQTPASFTWAVDTDAPNTSIDSNPAALTNSATASFSFSGSDAGGSGVAFFQCRIDSSQVSDWAACTSPKSYSGLADGSHKFEVRSVDQAHNFDQSPASFTWTVDTTPPTVSIDSGPSGLTNDSTPTFTFSSETGTTFECSIDTGAADFGSCSGNGTHTPDPPLADGSYTFRVRAMDAAGNPAVATRDFSVDAKIPNAPTLSGTVPASPANDNSPRITGSAPDGSTVRLYDTSDCSGSAIATATLAELESGITVSVADDSSTTFGATSTTPAGTTSPCSAPITYLEDSTSPQTGIDSKPPALTNSAAPSFGFSGADAGGSGVASFQCRIDSSQESDWTACGSPKSYASLADGSHTFEVRAIDKAGNTDQSPADFTWTVDTSPPAVSIDSGPSGLTNDSTPTFTFSSESGASFECSIDTGTPNFGSCSGAGSDTPASALADGQHTFRVRARDAAQNEAVATRSFQVDTAGPAAPTLGPAVPASPANDNSPEIHGSAPVGSTVRLFADDDCSGTPIATIPAAELTSGVEVTVADDSTSAFTATATSAAQNTSPCSGTLSYVEDSTAPDTQITEGPPSQVGSSNASFAFTGSDGSGSGIAALECSLDSGPWAGCESPLAYTGLSDGAHTFEVRAQDAAGNTDTTPARSEWLVDTSSSVPSQPTTPSSPSPTGGAEFIRLDRNLRSGTGVLIFRVTQGGRFSTRATPVSEIVPLGQKSDARSAAATKQLRLRQRSVRPASISVVGPGEVRVPIKLTGIGRRLLREGNRLRVRINVAFLARDGSKTTWKLNVVLKKQARTRKKAPRRPARGGS